MRVDKGGGFISEEFQGYCLQTGVSLEYDSTNTPQQIGMSERVGRTLVAMLRCILPAADCQNFSGEIFVFMAALLGNIAPHSAIGMQSPYKMPYGPELDLRLLRVIGARAFVHIETYSQSHALKAVKGRLLGYNNISRSYRVYHPATRRIMEGRNVIFIETPSRLFPSALEETSQQIVPPCNGMDDHNYITEDNVLRDLRDYTSVLEPLPGADHIAVGGLSDNPPVAELLERISEITRKGTLEGESRTAARRGYAPVRAYG